MKEHWVTAFLMFFKFRVLLTHSFLFIIRRNIFACQFSVLNGISLSPHGQVCLMRLRFERYFSHHRAFQVFRCNLIVMTTKRKS